jgi:hypothetical protein
MANIKKYKEPIQGVLPFFVDDSQYSQSIELYDAIPKYFWGKVQRDEKGRLDVLIRSFVHKGEKFEVEVHPATITHGEAVKQHYPGVREEMVEDALRKLATEGRIRRRDKLFGIEFSIYELQQELKRNGHSYSHNQIREAIRICSRTHLVVTRKKGNKIELGDNVFSKVGIAENSGRNGSDLVAVDFNILVTQSIEKGTHRQINYARSMSFKNSLARWLHKRMSHNYIQAQAFHNEYKIQLSTILRDSGITPSKKLGDSRRYVCKALDELLQQQVIYKYEQINIIKEGRKLMDLTFCLSPSITFSKEMKRANAISKSDSQITSSDTQQR